MNTLHCATPPSKSTGPFTGPRNRRAQRRRGMAAWVLGWGLIMLAPLWALSAYLAWEVHTTRKDSIHRELAQRSETAAHAVHERIETGIGLLQSLAVSDAALTNDLPALYRHAQRAAKQMPGVTGVGLLDQDRRMVFLTSRPYGTVLPPSPNTEMSKGVFANGVPTVSGYFVGPVSGKPVVALGIPVYQDWRLVYCLFLVLTADSLNELLHEQNLPQHWPAAIVDKSGRITARNQSPEIYVGTEVTPSLREAMADTSHGRTYAQTKEGKPAVVYVAPVPSHRWKVVVGVPEEIIDAPLHRSLAWLIALALTGLVAGACAAALKGRALARWSQELLHAVASIKAGHAVTLHPVRIRELDDMARSLIDMDLNTRAIRAELQLSEQERFAAQLALGHARCDALTGLPGRAYFREQVEHRQATLRPLDNHHLGMLFMDLDGFKAINDTRGHEWGDQVLVQVGAILHDLAADNHLVGRLGGDEFVMCVEAPADAMESVLDHMQERLRRRIASLAGLGCSVGHAVWDTSCPDYETLLRHADRAMYANKFRSRERLAAHQ